MRRFKLSNGDILEINKSGITISNTCEQFIRHRDWEQIALLLIERNKKEVIKRRK